MQLCNAGQGSTPGMPLPASAPAAAPAGAPAPAQAPPPAQSAAAWSLTAAETAPSPPPAPAAAAAVAATAATVNHLFAGKHGTSRAATASAWPASQPYSASCRKMPAGRLTRATARSSVPGTSAPAHVVSCSAASSSPRFRQATSINACCPLASAAAARASVSCRACAIWSNCTPAVSCSTEKRSSQHVQKGANVVGVGWLEQRAACSCCGRPNAYHCCSHRLYS